MKKIVIDVNSCFNPKDNDLLVYNQKEDIWEPQQVSYVLRLQDKKIEELQNIVKKQNEIINDFKNQIKNQINVISLLTKKYINGEF